MSKKNKIKTTAHAIIGLLIAALALSG